METYSLDPILRRYVVKAPAQSGTYHQRFGWRVVDRESGATVASTSESRARRWARALNGRAEDAE